MTHFLQRAQLLIQQSRFELAESELQQALVQNPNDALAHALLAICFTEQEKFKEATRAAETAIGLAPDSAYSFYVASRVSDARNQLAKAENEIQQAIAIDHEDPDFFAQLSQLKIQQRKWAAALDAAETGLEMDPEHVACTNLRAMAMVKLGKPVEADASIQAAMENSPDDGFSHANKGWALLEQGKPKESMPHFREALRLEPNMEWARAGIVESMKSQYLIYRLMLGWFFWASRLEGRTLTLILVGGFIGANFTSTLAEKVPFLQPFLLPFIIAYVGFVVMTWVSVPLFNLLLRFNKFGRLALSDEEKTTSTWVAVCLLLAIAFIISSFVTGYHFFLDAAIVTAVMTPLIGTYYSSEEGWPRAAHGLMLIGFTIFAAIIIGLAICGFVSRAGLQKVCQGLLVFLNTPLIVIAIGSQFAANFLTMAKPTRGTNRAKMVWIFGGAGLAVATVLVLGFIALVVSQSSQLN